MSLNLPNAQTAKELGISQDESRAMSGLLREGACGKRPGQVLDGESIARKLRSRRDFLDKAARAFYGALAERVLVIGTNEEDRFEVVRLTDEEAEVTVRRKSDGSVMYRRVFLRSQTEEIALHGLSGDDAFEVRGRVRKGIKVSLVGGDGQDEVKDASHVHGWGKKVVISEIEQGS